MFVCLNAQRVRRDLVDVRCVVVSLPQNMHIIHASGRVVVITYTCTYESDMKNVRKSGRRAREIEREKEVTFVT